MSRIFAVTNQKGGVGKTTSVASLSMALAELGKHTLAIDLDPQGHLTANFGLEVHDGQPTAYEVLFPSRSHIDLTTATVAARPHLDVLPASRDLAAAELLLLQQPAGGESALRKALKGKVNGYDFVLIDCPPSLGKLTVNALVAAEAVIVPVDSAYFALKGLGQLLETMEQVRDAYSHPLDIVGILLTMFDRRTLHAQEVEQRLRQEFDGKVFTTVIGMTVRLRDAAAQGMTILEFEPEHPAAQAYRNLAKEVLHYVETPAPSST